MDILIRLGVSSVVMTCVVGYALRISKLITWLICFFFVAILEIGVLWFDAAELTIEAILGATVTLLLIKALYKRDAKPTVLFVVCTLLLTTFLIDVAIGPKLRGAKELGRRQIHAPQDAETNEKTDEKTGTGPNGT